MKAISLWQPWASFVVQGHKQIETRHWPTNYRGHLLIHAAKKVIDDLGEELRRTLPFGAIIGIVHLVDCRRVEMFTDLTEKERDLGNYEPGRYGWALEDAEAWRPLPYKGSQGFFEVDDELIKRHLESVYAT